MSGQARAELSIPLTQAFLPALTGFVTEAAGALGLGRDEADRLRLAAEEVFEYLRRSGPTQESLRLHLSGHHYYVQVDFSIPGRDINWRYLNLTACVRLEDESSLEQMGLLLASRTVDRFYFREVAEGRLELSLIKEKAYPQREPQTPPQAAPAGEVLAIKPAGPEEFHLFSDLLRSFHPAGSYPEDFGRAEKLVDMAASGEYAAAVAADGRGRPGGGVVWLRRPGARVFQLFGPYLFGRPGDAVTATALVEYCLARLGRSGALGLLCLHPTPHVPLALFEVLGRIRDLRPDGRVEERPVFYRQLHEDPYGRVFVHPDLAGFLEAQYRRLSLTREVRPTRSADHVRPEHSVLAPEFDRSRNQVILRPLLDGLDFDQNLAQHVSALEAEGIEQILFELDLGQAWPAALVPDLFRNGFTPVLVLPHGGRADLVLFQHLS